MSRCPDLYVSHCCISFCVHRLRRKKKLKVYGRQYFLPRSILCPQFVEIRVRVNSPKIWRRIYLSQALSIPSVHSDVNFVDKVNRISRGKIFATIIRHSQLCMHNYVHKETDEKRSNSWFAQVHPCTYSTLLQNFLLAKRANFRILHLTSEHHYVFDKTFELA